MNFKSTIQSGAFDTVYELITNTLQHACDNIRVKPSVSEEV